MIWLPLWLVIIVIGLIGGTIAATVFAVIPWAQDNAAKQQLNSIVQAENAYMGLSAASTSSLPSGSRTNSFANSAELQAANLLTSGPTYCAIPTNNNQGFAGYAKSASGAIWSVTDDNTTPILYTGSLPADCQFIVTSGTPADTPEAYIDPTPTKTILTYRCDTTIIGRLPMQAGLTGTETWDDGTASRTYTNAAAAVTKSLTAGVTYTVTFDGTYGTFDSWSDSFARKWLPCLRSVDHWGSDTGVKNASYAFAYATNLTDVPDHIPTSINNMQNIFQNATSFNDPSVSKWDVSNVTDMTYAFGYASAFNQPLNDWNVSNVTTMNYMFNYASEFNQPLDKWDTSKVTGMFSTFANTTKFDQPLNTWNVSQVTNMENMFKNATVFNQPLDKWDVRKVTSMYYMFGNTANMYNDLSMWKTDSLVKGTYFNFGSKLPNTYLPPKTSTI